MKSFVAGGALTALGAATAASAIVVPQNSNMSYMQHPNLHPLPRSAVPAESNVQKRGLKMPIYRHSKRDMTNPDETMKFVENQLNSVYSKWASKDSADDLRKRQSIGLSAVGQDNFYFGQLSVGTPPQSFNMILDTGSADMWVVDQLCTSSQCNGNALFNTDASSTFQRSSQPFQITYGTGAVRGVLASDTVSLAGYTVDNQVFAIAEQLAQNTLNEPTSGIMGMGFQSLAQSGALPFWQVVVEQSDIEDKLFTFQLARNVQTARSADEVNPGGVFTLGVLDSSQYQGDIAYNDLTDDRGYWTIALDNIGVNGDDISPGTDNVAAIDTGTTLIVAPPAAARQIYDNIPGSQSISGGEGGIGSQGAYAIPCDANIEMSLTFGGQSYSINSADMNLGALDNDGNCLGGVLGASLGETAPGYIVGDVFLKNVFSVYDYTRRAIGFADLRGESAQTASTTSGAVQPTGTAAAGGDSDGGAAGGSPPIPEPPSGDSTVTGLPSPSLVTSSLPTQSVNLVDSNADTNGAGNTFTTSVMSAAVAAAFALGCAIAL